MPKFFGVVKEKFMKKIVITITSNYADVMFATAEDGTPLPTRFDLVVALASEACGGEVEIVSGVVSPVTEIVTVVDADGNDACRLAVFQILDAKGNPVEITFAM